MASSTTTTTPGIALDRLGLWPLRALWLAVPLAVGLPVTGAVDHFESPGPIILELVLWTCWFVGLVAVLAPSSVGLTVIRILTPGAVAVPVMALAADGGDRGQLAAAAVYGVLVVYACYLPVVGDRMVNGSAYGSERRMTLRPPAFAVLGPIQGAWLVVFAGVATAPVLAAGGRYRLAAVAVVLGVVAVWSGTRVLHQLARRWLVFVPAGFVIHDHVVAVESILLRRSIVEWLGPAAVPLDDEAIDLTGGARGLALQVATAEPVPFGRRIDGQVVNTEAVRLVFTPSLPGAVLTEARIRAIHIDAGPD